MHRADGTLDPGGVHMLADRAAWVADDGSVTVKPYPDDERSSQG